MPSMFFDNDSDKDKSPKKTESNKKKKSKKYGKPSKTYYKKFGPNGTQWIHDKQCDDELDGSAKKITKKVDKLMEVDYPAQRSEEWFAKRETCISASSGGEVVGVQPQTLPCESIAKKVRPPPFQSNKNCYHGTKHENGATMIYEYRMNVKVEEFGLVVHPKYKFLGASPDGIVGKYKADGKSLTKYVGRMLEIKCPVIRKIKKTGEIYGGICPKYYWVQVQLQLECCDLEECDFWQCEISEYDDYEDFVEDTDPRDAFRSKTTQMEKNCVIQMLPKTYTGPDSGRVYDEQVYATSLFIHPDRSNCDVTNPAEMSPQDCLKWVEKMKKIYEDPETCPAGYKEHRFDRVIYWRLEKSHSVTIKRDRKWFAEHLPVFEQMWKYVEFLRDEKNKEHADLFFDYLNYAPKNKKNEYNTDVKDNKKIMEVMETLYSDGGNKKKIDKIRKEMESNKVIHDAAEKARAERDRDD